MEKAVAGLISTISLANTMETLHPELGEIRFPCTVTRRHVELLCTTTSHDDLPTFYI